eukprot:1810933-Pleurochrysis_carterae.AAC.3
MGVKSEELFHECHADFFKSTLSTAVRGRGECAGSSCRLDRVFSHATFPPLGGGSRDDAGAAQRAQAHRIHPSDGRGRESTQFLGFPELMTPLSVGAP